MPKTQGTRDGYKASVRVGESPSETLECHADAFVYILRPKGSYSKVLKRLVIVMQKSRCKETNQKAIVIIQMQDVTCRMRKGRGNSVNRNGTELGNRLKISGW